MEEHVETRVRLIGAGLQMTLVGLAALQFADAGVTLVVLGTIATFGGLI